MTNRALSFLLPLVLMNGALAQSKTASDGNLLRNSSFERGSEVPFSWSFWALEPWQFTIKRVPEGGRGGGAYFRLEENVSTVMSAGMFRQEVAVEPNRRYYVGAWVRLHGGCVMVYVSRGDGRLERLAEQTSWRNSDLQPEFLGLDEVASPDPEKWVWLGGEIQTASGEDKIAIHLSCFGERSQIDFDDAFVGVTDPTEKSDGGNQTSPVVSQEAK